MMMLSFKVIIMVLMMSFLNDLWMIDAKRIKEGLIIVKSQLEEEEGEEEGEKVAYDFFNGMLEYQRQDVSIEVDNCVKECSWCLCKSNPQDPDCDYCWDECGDRWQWQCPKPPDCYDLEDEEYFKYRHNHHHRNNNNNNNNKNKNKNVNVDQNENEDEQKNSQKVTERQNFSCNFNPIINCQCGNISQSTGEINTTQITGDDTTETECPACNCPSGNISQSQSDLQVNCSMQTSNDCTNTCQMLSDISVTCTSTCAQMGLSCASNCPSNCSQSCVTPVVCINCILACINVCNEATRTCMSNQCGVTIPPIPTSNVTIAPENYIPISDEHYFLDNVNIDLDDENQFDDNNDDDDDDDYEDEYS